MTINAWLLIRREEGFCFEAFPGGCEDPLRRAKKGTCSQLGWARTVWPIHCPSNTVDSKVAPVKETRWRGIGTREARDGQTHPMEDRRLWTPSMVRTRLQPCDGFPQEAGR